MNRSTWRQPARRWAGLLLFAGLCFGCASTPQTRQLIEAPPPDIPPRVELADVPFFPQQEYHCGPAALASMLHYRGTTATPDEIARLIYVPELKGSLQAEVISATRHYDYLPVQLDGRLDSLLRELADGNPVFVLQNLGLDSIPVWHYEVVVGYDLDRGEMILRSGLHRRIVRRFRTFEQTWARAGHWALVVTRPDRIPPTAPASSFVDAAIGMEQIGKIDPAHLAYGSALRRWPDNLLARAGLGNTAYALGEFSAAEAAYREALAIDPRRADLWNNLAYALHQLGRHEASLQAVRRAVELEPDNQNFRDSMRELGGSQ